MAVSNGAVAMPLVLVIAVAVADPAKEADAPVDGAVKVTVTPLTGLLPRSVTVAASGVVNGAFTTVLCVAPAVATIATGAPAVLLRLKLAGVAPGAVAVTV